MAKTSNNNDAWHVKARNELTQLLRQNAFSQSVGEQLVTAALAANGFLPVDYQPAKRLLTAANNCLLARTYLGQGVTASSVRLLNEVLHFPARAWVHCIHPALRLAFMPMDGTADDDVRRLTVAEDPRWTMPDYITPVNVVMKTVCKGAGKRERETGQLQVTPHGGIKAVELHDQLVKAVRMGNVPVNADCPDTVLLAFVVNGQRGDDDAGKIKFLNLTKLVTVYAGTKLMKDGGRAVAISALVDDHELWMTPVDCVNWLLSRYKTMYPGTVANAFKCVQTMAAHCDAVGYHQLSCVGSGRLALRPMRVDRNTGEHVHGFMPADYCTTVHGLFLRDHVRQACIELMDAVHALTALNSNVMNAVYQALLDMGLAIPTMVYQPVKVNLTVDPFASAYSGTLRVHPAGYVDADELVATVWANRLPVVANLPVINNIKAMPPIVVNDVDWPDCGPWPVIER